MKSKSAIRISVLLLTFLLIPKILFSQSPPPAKPRMQYMGTFDAGQQNAGIFKMYDASDDIVCYILAPESVSRKKIENTIIYEANNLGSISCVKVRYDKVQENKVKPKK